MKIKLLKAYGMLNAGQELDVGKGVGIELVKRGIAERIERDRLYLGKLPEPVDSGQSRRKKRRGRR